MKKATLVLATAVAFLLSGPVFAARKVVDMPTTSTILKGSSSTIAENGILKVSGGALTGEFLPGVKNALAIIPETKIASTAISTVAKNVIKGGVAGIVVGAALDELINGVGWVIDEGGNVVKSGEPGSAVPTTGSAYYSWTSAGGSTASTAQDGCFAILNEQGSVSAWGGRDTKSMTGFSDPTHANCQSISPRGDFLSGVTSTRLGSGCPSNSTYSSNVGACISNGTLPGPVTDSDMTVLDGFIKGKDGVWQRDLATGLCQDNADCYKSLSPDTSLTGPSTVTGTPQTVTTTSPSGTVSTSVKTPTSTITYGPNYYDYTTTTTTTNNNGGDSTTVTDDTDTSFPVPPDIFGGANDGIGGVRDGIPTTASTTNPIPYMAWWSFSQSCSEITFVIPIYGAVTTALCPIYKQYIWPVLYFFFAVFTWLTCFEIWRKTVMRVRAS